MESRADTRDNASRWASRISGQCGAWIKEFGDNEMPSFDGSISMEKAMVPHLLIIKSIMDEYLDKKQTKLTRGPCELQGYNPKE